jgi:hypothetical protein
MVEEIETGSLNELKEATVTTPKKKKTPTQMTSFEKRTIWIELM